VSETPLVELCEVRFGYAPERPVICGVSLDVPHGAMCAIIGANGCGKSTLIRLMAGVLRPASGEIHLDGRELRSIPPRALAKRIAYVPQASRMAFPFTALEVVLTGRTPHTPRFQFENENDCEKAREALATVDALHLAGRRVTELSGGELQIVALARALAQEPACLLLDEPSAALDLKHRAALLRILARLRDERGLSAVVVTHDLNLIDPVFDWVFAIRCGTVSASGAPSEILQREVLAAIYDDSHVRTCRLEGHTMVWSE
jgi:iron complex transport system ATP-binding protein